MSAPQMSQNTLEWIDNADEVKAALQLHWRQKPFLWRRLISPHLNDVNWRLTAESWCREDHEARIFTLDDEAQEGRSSAARCASALHGLEIFKTYSGNGERLTLLLNDVELVEPSLVRLRNQLDIGHWYRFGDVVMTLSSPGSGIGFHGGNEDGVIVQLSGKRRWRVWSPEASPPGYNYELMGMPVTDFTKPFRPNSHPLIDCELAAGDALYIPALHGHEGETIETSTSIAVSWRGLSVASIIRSAVPELESNFLDGLRRDPNLFCTLLEDSPHIQDPVEFLLENVEAKVSSLNLQSHKARIEQFVRAYVSRNRLLGNIS